MNKLPLKKLVRVVAATAVGITALAYSGLYVWHWWSIGRFLESTDNAYVRGEVTPVAPKVAGYVAEVRVDDNQPVRAGDVLFHIDDADYRAEVARAQAEVAARRTALVTLDREMELQRAVIAQAEADVLSTQAEVHRAKLDHARYAALVREDAANRQRLESAAADAVKADAALKRASARLAAERSRLKVLQSRRMEAEAALVRAQAALTLAEIALADTVVRAPVAGVVGNRQVRVGRYVSPGVQLLAIVPLDGVWVVANFKETQLTDMRVGQHVEVAVDSFPGKTVTGTIASLAPASGAVFALLPPDNATGNFTKIVQRIPVKIVLDRDHPLFGELRPGMSVIATVDTRGAGEPPVGAAPMRSAPPVVAGDPR